jgi:hypothetical protein
MGRARNERAYQLHSEERPRVAAHPPGKGRLTMRGLWLLCMTLVLLTAGCGGSATLTEHSLRKEAEKVQSSAAEGALLAADVARGRTTEPFARIHSGKLAEQAKSVANVLRTAKAPGIEADRRQAAATAAEVEQALERLHSAPTDRVLAGRLQHALEREAAAAGKLAR